MGKTPKPLTILVHPSLANSPEILELAAKGHEIHTEPSMSMIAQHWQDYDLVLGPTCWRMDASMLAYLDLAIKGARTVKYPKKERSEPTNAVREASVGDKE